jgi:hypothetical protein
VRARVQHIRQRVHRGFAFVVLALSVGAAGAWGQLLGHISMAKEVYLAGEPIYVHFEVTNVGTDAVEYVASDPYVKECTGFRIEVNGPSATRPFCGRAWVGSCITTDEILAPGATLKKNILVNYAHDVGKPGDYNIHAIETLAYARVTEELDSAAEKQNFHFEERLHLQVAKGERDILEQVYQPYVTNLRSPDDDIQREAERAIVSGAPPWLEDTIVGMVRRYTSREFALLGLRNLNTERSRAELAKIVQNTAELTPVNEMAVRYLGQMGDKKYFPLLMEMVKGLDAKESREYVLAAAELGGDDAVPYLRGLLGSADANVRTTAVLGLGATGSRAAVPVLLEVLKEANEESASVTAGALTELTHWKADDPPGDAYGKWAGWWEKNGDGAKIYGAGECEEEGRKEVK